MFKRSIQIFKIQKIKTEKVLETKKVEDKEKLKKLIKKDKRVDENKIKDDNYPSNKENKEKRFKDTKVDQIDKAIENINLLNPEEFKNVGQKKPVVISELDKPCKLSRWTKKRDTWRKIQLNGDKLRKTKKLTREEMEHLRELSKDPSMNLYRLSVRFKIPVPSVIKILKSKFRIN